MSNLFIKVPRRDDIKKNNVYTVYTVGTIYFGI